VKRPHTLVLVGPTAVGKTAVAAALADRAGLPPITVISADARQVYRGLDLGTAKPDLDLRRRVPHRGLDLVDPGERYSAGRFAREAAGWLAEERAGGHWPIVVGGTGFYVRALAEGLFREPPLEPARRERLLGWSAAIAPADLARWAGRLDRHYTGGGRQRAARVVEVALLTGRSLSWWQREARDTGAMRPWYIHLTLPRDTLRARIATRVDRMLAAGFVDEVRRVLAQGVRPDGPGLDGVGYREVVAMLEGRLHAAQLREAIVTATRRYAKRQETWFRHQLRPQTSDVRHQLPDVWRLDAVCDPRELAELIIERWNALQADV
jgi:tRNA dimethylallyltransferase